MTRVDADAPAKVIEQIAGTTILSLNDGGDCMMVSSSTTA